MTHYAHQLLIDCLTSQGLGAEEAALAVQVVMGAAVAADLIPAARLESWEQDARIYHLRGQGVTCVTLGIRFSVSKALVFKAIRRHQKRRRAALGTKSTAA